MRNREGRWLVGNGDVDEAGLLVRSVGESRGRGRRRAGGNSVVGGGHTLSGVGSGGGVERVG